MSLLSKLVHFVLLTTKKYEIDESHGLSHSMNVLHYANKIYETEVENYPILKNQEKLIYVSAVLHDMCDKKYVDEIAGLKEIETFLQDEHALTPTEINMSKQIMSTMSYSKVKQYGFPIMGGYQKAYHIVREADLLTAYDFDRCMIYQMNKNCGDLEDAFKNANELFENRVLRHNDDNLFLFDYSKQESLVLHELSLQRIHSWKKLLIRPGF
jgi:HD superfamily phosphodiesterase